MPTASDEQLLSIINGGPDLAKSHLRGISKAAASVVHFAFLMTQKADSSLNGATRKDCDDLVWVDIAIEALELSLKNGKQSPTVEEEFRAEFSIIRLRVKCIQKFGIDSAPDCLRVNRLNDLVLCYSGADIETYNSEATLVSAYAADSTNNNLRIAILRLRHRKQIMKLVLGGLGDKFVNENLPSLSKYIGR